MSKGPWKKEWLVDSLLVKTNKAVTDHQASDPCAGLNTERRTLTSARDSKATAVETATAAVREINSTIATKTARRTEASSLITASATEIQARENEAATLRNSLSNVSAAWGARIAEAQQVIDQIAAFQELVVGGKKLSLLQSSLVELGAKVSLPIRGILTAQSRIAKLLGKQTSDASLNPSMIEEEDATDKLKELFAALKAELEAHLTQLQSDKSTEEASLQTQIDAKATQATAETQTKTNLEKEVNDITTDLASLVEQRTAANTGVATAQRNDNAAEEELTQNAAAISSCEQKYAQDLKALQDEHTAVQSIKTKLTAWKTGGSASLEAENVKKVSVAGSSGVQVTCKTTIDNTLKYIKYNGQELQFTGNAGSWNNDKSFVFTTVSNGVLEIMGHDQEALNTGHCRTAGFAIQCDATGDDFWNNFDSGSVNILAAGGKDANNGNEWNEWKAPCTTTSGFSMPANRSLKKLWAPNGERYGKFKMGPSVTQA